MGLQIQPQYMSLGQFLANRLFRIPDYQRAYSWEAKQRSDLFDDIINTFDKGDDAQHFMATVVALRRNQKLIGTNQHYITEIVDGQQRITTLITLFKAIELALDRNKPNERQIAEEISTLLVKPDSNSLLLLQTNHDSSHYFSQYLREGTHPDTDDAKTTADKHILSAMTDCEAFVSEWKKRSDIPSLVSMLKNRLTFVLHEIEDESAVYTVFEVLNSRGLDVSWLDRLKSILMGTAFESRLSRRAKAELISELHTVWRDIYSCIGLRLGMSNEALRFAATLRSGSLPNRPLGEEDSVQMLQMQSRTPKEILATAHWLLSVTKACDKVRASPRLNAVARIVQARLLATAIHLRPDLSATQRSELLEIWEKVTFRIYGMLNNDARTSVGDYVRLAWSVIDTKPKPDQIAKSIRSLGAEYPIADAIDSLRNSDCYSDWQENLRYFFFRYEEHLAKKQKQNFNNKQWDRIWVSSPSDSIEHIWPQSRAPEKQVHRLGNLVLLPPKLNSKLGAMRAVEKKDAYIQTGLLIAGEVAKQLQQAWNAPAIDARENEILKWAAMEWG